MRRGAVRAPAARSSIQEDDATRVSRQIFESVMSQRLTPGTKLPEVALCELFGVGRTLIRKVLQELAHDHIVELRPNRGAVVAAPSPEETRQIFEARRALESALLPMAVANATRADIAALRRQLRDEHAALHASGQPAWARLASSFHLQVAALARNRILQQYLTELISRCSLIVALYEPPGNAACEHDEHARIVALLEKRDATGAVRLMDTHLRDLERRICLERPASSDGLKQMLGI
jgi:DNA-binding GntR family transcriptional regulator